MVSRIMSQIHVHATEQTQSLDIDIQRAFYSAGPRSFSSHFIMKWEENRGGHTD